MNLNLEISSCLRMFHSLCYVETWYQKNKLLKQCIQGLPIVYISDGYIFIYQI